MQWGDCALPAPTPVVDPRPQAGGKSSRNRVDGGWGGRGGTEPRGQSLQALVRQKGDPLLLVRLELQKSTQPWAGMPLSSPNCPPCRGPPTPLSSLRPERGCAERQESDEGGQGLIGQPHLPQAGLGGTKPSWSLASASPGPSGHTLPYAPPPTAPGVLSPKPGRQRPHTGLLPSAAPRPLT